MKTLLIRSTVMAMLALLVLAGAALSPEKATTESVVGNELLDQSLQVALGRGGQQPALYAPSAALVQTMLDQTGELNRRARQAGFRPPPIELPLGGASCETVLEGNGQVNVRVNKDCSVRQQAGESIAVNAEEPQRLLAAQNDSRLGFNHCGVDWSSNGGLEWGDLTPPFWQAMLLSGNAADACVDPTVTWDSKGNAYTAATVLEVGSNSKATSLVVSKSNAGIGGAFFHSPDPTGGFQEYRALPLGVVWEANDPNVALDKPSIVVDTSDSSPRRDYVYVTWTLYGPEQESSDRGPEGIRAVSPIYFSQSTDGGATWSLGIEINGTNTAICTGLECFNDQGSSPVVGSDGTIYVTFANRDAPDLVQQIIVVKCVPTADCTRFTEWTPPARVSTIFGHHPTGPSSAGCPLGRQCLPPNGYTVTESTSISTSIDSEGNLFTVWADFRNNTNDDCRGAADVAAPPCDNDVFYSYSTDGGNTWSEAKVVTPRSNPRFGETAQWLPWSTMAANGHLWIAFYDRSFGSCELEGCNDVTAAEITNPASPSPTYSFHRVTTESMPNLTAQNNPLQAGFIGDRIAIDTDSANRAHIVWADTRPRTGATPEEDVYYARVPALPAASPPPPPPPPPPPYPTSATSATATASATATTSATAAAPAASAAAPAASAAARALPSAQGRGNPSCSGEGEAPSSQMLSRTGAPGTRRQEEHRPGDLPEPTSRRRQTSGRKGRPLCGQTLRLPVGSARLTSSRLWLRIGPCGVQGVDPQPRGGPDETTTRDAPACCRHDRPGGWDGVSERVASNAF